MMNNELLSEISRLKAAGEVRAFFLSADWKPLAAPVTP